MAHSSRGLGHLPLKEEITGSNPVCATKDRIVPCSEAKSPEQGALLSRFANSLLITPLRQLIRTLGINHSVRSLRGYLPQRRGDAAVGIKVRMLACPTGSQTILRCACCFSIKEARM